jgi:polyketide cyclase/dehydrase/lipid transport protein
VYEFFAETTIEGTPSQAWEILTDVDRWPDWDPHEEAARIEGPFAVGTSVWAKPRGGPASTATITAVEEGRGWSSECPLPGGRLRGHVELEPCRDGRLRIRKTMQITGPLTPLFRLHYGRRIRRDMFLTFEALEARMAARGAAVASRSPTVAPRPVRDTTQPVSVA